MISRQTRTGTTQEAQHRKFTYPNPGSFPIFLLGNADYAGRSLINGSEAHATSPQTPGVPRGHAVLSRHRPLRAPALPVRQGSADREGLFGPQAGHSGPTLLAG